MTQSSQTISVATIADNATEPAETVLMTLSNPTGGATIQAGGQGTGTINASGTNSPPTAVTDNVSIARCTAGSFNVVANDTDPEGDYPLTLVGVSGQAAQQGASVGRSTSVAWEKARYDGLYSMAYTVNDNRGLAPKERSTSPSPAPAPQHARERTPPPSPAHLSNGGLMQ